MLKSFKVFFAALLGHLFIPGFIFSAPILRQSVSQYGITWEFDKQYPTGQFANGDYWVLGPVKITRMSPDFDGTLHGFEINPDASTAYTQSYDGRGKAFSASKLPALPFLAQANTSIVKAISFTDEESYANCTPTSFRPKCLKTSAVLSVLASVPPGDGARYLRPPYPGPEKPLFSLDEVNMALFSRFAVPSGVTLPSPESLTAKLIRVQIDHKPNGVTNEHTEPWENLPTYSPSQYQIFGDAFGRLFFKDLNNSQRDALLAVVLQAGMDRFYAAKHGAQTWPGGSGVTPAKKMMTGIFVALLGNEADQKYFSEITFFDENKLIRFGKNNVALYGGDRTETKYWDDFLGASKYNTSHFDFYGYTDGGGKINDDIDNYQYCCRAEPWRGGLVALKLIPRLGEIWNNAEPFENYVKRYISSGLRYQPDPCAPAQGVCVGGVNDGKLCTSANQSTACSGGLCDYQKEKTKYYRITYGPDGKGGCILDKDPSDGLGRLPQLHGKKHGTLYGSPVIRAIWSNFYETLFGPVAPTPKSPGNVRIQ